MKIRAKYMIAIIIVIIAAVFVSLRKPLFNSAGSNIIVVKDGETIYCEEDTEIINILADYKGWRIGEKTADFLLGQNGSGDWNGSIAIHSDGELIEKSPDGTISDGKNYIYLSLINNSEKGRELYDRLVKYLE